MNTTGICGEEISLCDQSQLQGLTEIQTLQSSIGDGDRLHGCTLTKLSAPCPSTPSANFQQWVDLRWSVMGDRIPSDHNYRLYSALIEQIPKLKEIDWQLGTLTGIPDRQGWIKLGRKSVLSVRCPIAHTGLFGVLDERILRCGQSFLQLGAMQGSSLQPHPSLSARLVVIKQVEGTEVSPFSFGVAVGRQLEQLGIKVLPEIGCRGSVRVKGYALVGYGVRFSGLSPEDSIALQVSGLGGKRKMGCGVFYGA